MAMRLTRARRTICGGRSDDAKLWPLAHGFVVIVKDLLKLFDSPLVGMNAESRVGQPRLGVGEFGLDLCLFSWSHGMPARRRLLRL